MKAKAIIEALVERQQKVKTNTEGKRLAKVESRATLADRVVAAEVDRLGDKLSIIKTEALVDALVCRVKEVDVETLCYTVDKVDAETLIYTLADRLPVVEEDKVGNTPAKESKAVLDTLAAKETEVKIHTLGDTLSKLKNIETFDTLSHPVAENEVESLGDTQIEVNAKALDYQMPDREAEVKVDKLGDTSQHRK